MPRFLFCILLDLNILWWVSRKITCDTQQCSLYVDAQIMMLIIFRISIITAVLEDTVQTANSGLPVWGLYRCKFCSKPSFSCGWQPLVHSYIIRRVKFCVRISKLELDVSKQLSRPWCMKLRLPSTSTVISLEGCRGKKNCSQSSNELDSSSAPVYILLSDIENERERPTGL